MEGRELCGQILGIGRPWGVERVALKLEDDAVHAHWRHEEDALWECAECGQLCRLHDHQQERQGRRLDTCQFQTILHARPPRTRCDEHGALVARSLWAEAGSRFTLLLEAVVIHWLGAASQKAVAERIKLSWDEAHGIMERAVKRGLRRRAQEPVAYWGVDEKAFPKGHQYFTLVNDPERGRVL
jgi:transposase